MREVLIKTIYKEKDYYEVRLGNGTSHRFASQKAARKFLADTNRFLSGISFQVNQILAEIYTHGREIWIISPEADHRFICDKIEMLQHFIKQAYDRAWWKSGNYFVFIDLKKFCDHAKSIIKFFQHTRFVSKTDTLRKHKLEYLFDQVQAIHLRILNYGQSQAYQTFSTSKIEDFSRVVDYTFNLRVA